MQFQNYHHDKTLALVIIIECCAQKLLCAITRINFGLLSAAECIYWLNHKMLFVLPHNVIVFLLNIYCQADVNTRICAKKLHITEDTNLRFQRISNYSCSSYQYQYDFNVSDNQRRQKVTHSGANTVNEVRSRWRITRLYIWIAYMRAFQEVVIESR